MGQAPLPFGHRQQRTLVVYTEDPNLNHLLQARANGIQEPPVVRVLLDDLQRARIFAHLSAGGYYW